MENARGRFEEPLASSQSAQARRSFSLRDEVWHAQRATAVAIGRAPVATAGATAVVVVRFRLTSMKTSTMASRHTDVPANVRATKHREIAALVRGSASVGESTKPLRRTLT